MPGMKAGKRQDYNSLITIKVIRNVNISSITRKYIANFLLIFKRNDIIEWMWLSENDVSKLYEN